MRYRDCWRNEIRETGESQRKFGLFRHCLPDIIQQHRNFNSGPQSWYRLKFWQASNCFVSGGNSIDISENGEWRRLHNEELHSLYRSPNIVRLIKSRRLRRIVNLTRMGEVKSAFKILTHNPEERVFLKVWV